VALLTSCVLVWVGALAVLTWLDLEPPERASLAALLRPRGGLLLLFTLALPLLLWLLLRPWVAAWPRAAQRLREEVEVVSAAHAGHRVRGDGGAPELRELAAAIDALAQRHAALQEEVATKVQSARAAVAEETRRLAALMAELTLGVLVCNRDGRVLLYNARATALLGVAPLGLGRMVGSLLDAGAIEHAWQQLLRGLERREPHVVAHFVTACRGGPTGAAPAAEPALLRVQMVPTQDEAGAANGYVLLLDDITRAVHQQGRRETLLHRLTEGTRAALGNLRAAAQALQAYPTMDAAQRARFTGVVHEEAERLAAQLAEALHEPAAQAGAWPLHDVRLIDLAWALQRRLRELGVACRCEGVDATRWLHVDSRAVVQLLALCVARLVADGKGRGDASGDASDFALEIGTDGSAPMRLELGWSGPPLAPGTLGAWEAAPLAPVEAQGPTLTLRDVLDRHGAEWWSHAGSDGRQHLSVQLGAATVLQRPGGEPGGEQAVLPRGRPIAYDFDLFRQAGQNADLDQTPLAALRCTVFDTETTGLSPSEGDEIIAIGAVRIVNARLLEQEVFDRRVLPRRPVRASAEAAHGISTASLRGEPPLEQVLPLFARFCDDTVLVAHNAAFDMRFLELARERTGVRFDQPLLDTMLLSAVVLPAHRGNEHHLEQIAVRLGVSVAGRHQALGDATTTARVLLKLLPLLAERGITTLGQARAASQGVAAAHHETY
jgi:DNA polymerase-3 subunit epsilon